MKLKAGDKVRAYGGVHSGDVGYIVEIQKRKRPGALNYIVSFDERPSKGNAYHFCRCQLRRLRPKGRKLFVEYCETVGGVPMYTLKDAATKQRVDGLLGATLRELK